MAKGKTAAGYSPGARERAVRMVPDHGENRAPQWAAAGSIAAEIGRTTEAPRRRVRRAGPGAVAGSGPARPRASVSARRCRSAETASRAGPTGSRGRRRPVSRRRSSAAARSRDRFIGERRGAHGVEPIRRLPSIAPSIYHARVARWADPAEVSARARRDAGLRAEIRRVFDENSGVRGVRKAWRQLRREGTSAARSAARCAVARPGAADGVARGGRCAGRGPGRRCPTRPCRARPTG
jgi:hypothetical protein